MNTAAASPTSEQSPTEISVVPSRPERVRIAIVGTGFAGLGAAIRLRQSGIDDFVVLERANDVGGTWRDNTYPGCACDVPSHLYSFSFAPNPEWSRTYSPQPEIWAYLRGCADREGIRERIRWGSPILDASWDNRESRWLITTPKGEISAQILILGTGALVEPALPKVPGLETFQGTVFHSARWNAEHRLDGERVAVIGTGASAIQFVPAIQPKVASLHLFQRTPPWILPHPDRTIRPRERALYRRLPLAQLAVRTAIYWTREISVLGFTKRPQIMKAAESQARKHLAAQVPDPALRAKLTPNYAIGCKRILLSNAYYPAVSAPNVELVTDGITEIRPHSIVTADGVEREIDTIIWGTGFHVTDHPIADLVHGRDGRSMAEASGPSPRAYLGTTHAGFPNLFHLTGPNTGLGHTSMVFMIESQLNYILDAIRQMDAGGIGTIDVRPEVEEAYNRELDKKMTGTVWASGCASWYLDATGRNSTLWPDFTWAFRRRTRHFDAASYRFERQKIVAGGSNAIAPATLGTPHSDQPAPTSPDRVTSPSS